MFHQCPNHVLGLKSPEGVIGSLEKTRGRSFLEVYGVPLNLFQFGTGYSDYCPKYHG
jgi:hypothetical protein